MTHFVRFAMVGALVAGASLCAVAQDDDSLEALLGDLVEDVAVEEASADDVAEVENIAEDAAEDVAEVAEDAADAPAEEIAETPAEEVADEIADAPAEEVADVANEPAGEVAEIADEPAEEVAEAVDENADLDALLGGIEDAEPEAPAEEVAEVADEPADEPAEEVAEVVAEPETPAEEVAEVADEPADEPAEEVAEVADESETPAKDMAPLLDALDALVEEVVVAEPVDEPAEEVAEVADEPETPAEEIAEVVDEPAEEVAEVVDVPVEEVAVAEPGDEPAEGEGLIADVEPNTEELDARSEKEDKFNELALLMELKNRGLDNHAYDCLNKARQLMTTPPPPGKAFNQYADAIKMYKDAQKYFRQREENLPLRNECDIGIREAEYRQARVRFEEGNYKEALEMAQSVNLGGHAQGAALVAIIQEEMNKPAEIRAEPVLPEYAKDKHKLDRLAIQERMRRATVYFQLAKYKDANDQLELILRDDPNNEEAINLRTRVARRHADRNRQLKYSTHDEMISQVELNWTPLGALGRNSEELYTPTESKGAATKVNKEGEKDAATVMEKLQYIRLPEFTIRPPSTLADAVALFAELSKAYDKQELPPEEKGVAFVLNMGKPAPAAEASEEDPFASDSGTDSGLPPIASISMPWVTLKEALDMVCEVTGSKYVIKGKIVMIVPATHVAGEMVTRSYNVMAGLMEKLGAVETEMGSSSSDGGWGMEDSGSLSASSTDGDTLKRVFTDLGVPFDGDAKVAYLPTIGKLRVTNTAENLAILEGILEDLNVTPSQIEVEARFVEVSQQDLNSLGFEWRLNSDIVGTIGSGIDWAESVISGNVNRGNGAGGVGANGNVFRPGVGGTGDANVAVHGGQLNNGMRFLGDDAAYANRINLAGSSIAPDDTFASFSAVFGRVDLTMILHMLAQRSDTDMLSSPKVLARPGQEALIRVVTEHIYPTEFDITELEEAEQNWNGNNNNDGLLGGGGNNVQMNAPPVKFAVEPQSFEKMDVGVSLQVVPELSQEGQMINMLVNPKVVEYLGDFDYGMKVPYIQYGMTAGVVTSAEVRYYNVEMPQPKFHVREINTYISVYNGSTVVMGGLITETRKSFEDKVPFFGDLPFIGFLFRSKGEFSEKRNLLVFLTARLVDPAGRPLKTATDGRMGNATMDTVSAETMGAATQE